MILGKAQRSRKRRLRGVNFFFGAVRLRHGFLRSRDIKRAAEKRGITVSEYLRQSVNSKMSRERPMDWYSKVARLEEICTEADSETRAKLVEFIRSLYKGGA